MDRRQKKTRQAIFKAFSELASEKSFDKITISEIIERADIGRATFYAHFETKDFLLKELCKELFEHVFESAIGDEHAHKHIFDCDAPDSVFLHLFQHLKKNDNNILKLLSCSSNELFLRYFKTELKRLVACQMPLFEREKSPELPKDFYINHISATFVETVRFWIDTEMQESPEQMTKYFFLLLKNT